MGSRARFATCGVKTTRVLSVVTSADELPVPPHPEAAAMANKPRHAPTIHASRIVLMSSPNAHGHSRVAFSVFRQQVDALGDRPGSSDVNDKVNVIYR